MSLTDDCHVIRIREYVAKEFLQGGEIVGELVATEVLSVRVCATWQETEAIATKLLTAWLRSNPGHTATYSYSRI